MLFANLESYRRFHRKVVLVHSGMHSDGQLRGSSVERVVTRKARVEGMGVRSEEGCSTVVSIDVGGTHTSVDDAQDSDSLSLFWGEAE